MRGSNSASPPRDLDRSSGATSPRRTGGEALVHPSLRLANGLVSEEGIDAVKVVSSPFMSAAFFWTIYLVAPSHRRRPIAIAALIIIGIWGVPMVVGSATSWPRFDDWLLGIGLGLWLGGGLSYWLARRFQAQERDVG